MKLFISYAHADRAMVQLIKIALSTKHGFDVFVAHDDIGVSEEWRAVILRELETCEVFIPILTPQFAKSDWTDQETGFALSRQIKIIPVNAGIIPYGFIQTIQALPFRDTADACNKIVDSMVKTPELMRETINSLIKAFGASDSYDNAADRIDLLTKYQEKLSDDQNNAILRIACVNNQIHGGRRPRNRIINFINCNRAKLDTRQIERFESLA